MLYVSESLVISQGGKLVALIYPDWEQVDKAGIQHSEIEKLMQQNIDQLNTTSLPPCEITNDSET